MGFGRTRSARIQIRKQILGSRLDVLVHNILGSFRVFGLKEGGYFKRILRITLEIYNLNKSEKSLAKIFTVLSA